MKLLLTALGFFLGLFSIQTSPVAFQSRESKTTEGKAVYNRVQFVPGAENDVWLMQQQSAHDDGDYGRWDRLKIVVDKTKKPYVAIFYQLESGELSGEGRPAPFRAQCFKCHANGPRALRPVTENLSLWQRGQVWMWNLRIKTYGEVRGRAADRVAESEFRPTRSLANERLPLKSCRTCHKADGVRSPLTFAHAGTAQFLVEQGEMPPFPYRITKQEISALKNYAEMF